MSLSIEYLLILYTNLPSFEIKDLLGNKESEEVKKLRMEKEKILLQKKQKQMQEELKKQQLKERPLVYAYNSDKSNSTIEIIPNKFDLSKMFLAGGCFIQRKKRIQI